ncbi:MAG: hypothetical protein H7Z76_06025 [Methylotenera sp.]|nr:hypothetical protein [Flavobacterium sp.]
MPSSQIVINANSETDLLVRKDAINAINAMPTDQLKRLSKLVKSPKAKNYLSSDLQFAILSQFL